MLKTLITLLKIPTEKGVRKWIRSNFPVLNLDPHGNLYYFNPGKPLLCAHMDTVVSDNDAKLLKNIEITETGGFSFISGDGVIGADDKCGIAIALKIWMDHFDDVSVLFTSGEESGGVGARAFNKKLITDAKLPYCVVIDRKGKSDIIGAYNEYCTCEFDDKIAELLKPFGYKPAIGVYSDADQLNMTLNCVNLSCGYYGQHSKDENVVIKDFLHAHETIEWLVLNYTEWMTPLTQEDIAPQYKIGGYGNRDYPYLHSYDFGYDDEDEEYGDPIEYYGEGLVVARTITLIDYSTGHQIQIPKGDYYIMDYAGKSFLGDV